MLEQEIQQQLELVFGGLESDISFALHSSKHESQGELRTLLQDVAATSKKLSVVESGKSAETVRFEVLKNGVPVGISFRGVPGGHEFTSLILAVLNSDGKGRLPDAGLQGRVRSLHGPVQLRTFISLSCTNCPDVVQALNQMTLFHGDFRHEMVDGGLHQEEVERLGIQGVPAVFAGDKLIHVGKAGFADLLEALENHYGKEVEPSISQEVREVDVAVLGGGPSGSTAAIYSARKGLKTAMIAQRVGGQVNETLGIENLISVIHTEGPKLAADLANHIRQYPVEILENRKVESIVDSDWKEIHLQGGEVVKARSVIVATGAKWRELGVPGEKEHIGRGVAFCPHCDGPFFKGKRVAVVGGGNSGVEAAIDLAGICSHVTLLEFAEHLKADRVLVEKLHSLQNVKVITQARTSEVVGDGTAVNALRYENRQSKEIHTVELDGVFVQIGLVPNSSFIKDIVETNRMGEIVVDAHCRTNVPGIYAAGDVSTVPYKQIVIAMGEGAKAALSAFEDRMRKTS